MEDSWRHFTLSECEGGERIDDRDSIPDYWEGVGLQVVLHCTLYLFAKGSRFPRHRRREFSERRAYAREHLANPRPSRSSHFPLPASHFQLGSDHSLSPCCQCQVVLLPHAPLPGAGTWKFALPVLTLFGSSGELVTRTTAPVRPYRTVPNILRAIMLALPSGHLRH